MLEFVKNAFRGFMEIILWFNLIAFAVGGGYIGNIIGGRDPIYIICFSILGIIIGLIINILFGGFMANFLKLCENVESIINEKPRNSNNEKIWNKKYSAIIPIELKKIPDSSEESFIQIEKGEIIDYLEQVSEENKTKIIWYKIKYKDNEGWCNSSNIEKYFE